MDVELRDINKTFGTIRANIDITLRISSGTIQGILGENGAGKSTLMKVLSGFIEANSGEVVLNDQVVRISSPADAIEFGVGMLHQDPLDFPPMKAIDNFIIGQRGRLFPDQRKARKAFKELREQFDFSINPDDYVDTMTVGERQQLEILRLLWLGVEVFILDEPTTGISALQKEKLFHALRALADEGKAIIFVSHKLEDVEELCTRVAVLRRGELVGELSAPFDTDDLVRMMFGKEISLDDRVLAESGEPVLQLKDVFIEDHRLRIENVNITVRAREVVGLAGMEGSGQDLLLRACAGLVRTVGGLVLVKGEDSTGENYHRFMKKGVTYMPAARMEEGLIEGLSIAEHEMLVEKQKGIFINKHSAQELAQQKIKDYSIKGVPESRVEELSGGNQQRTLLALLRDPLSLLLMEHPTRGLDIESTIYIWSRLKDRCRQGTAVLFISPDLEEILQYSDRILVFFSGRVSPMLKPSMVDVDILGQLIGGKGWNEVFRYEETQ